MPAGLGLFRILECRGGKLIQVKPLAAVELRYPGRGTRKVWTVGHPEPVAFSWSYPEIQLSSCYMVMPTLTAGIFRELSDKIDEGQLTLEEAGHQLVEQSKNISLIGRIEGAMFQLLDRPHLPFSLNWPLIAPIRSRLRRTAFWK